MAITVEALDDAYRPEIWHEYYIMLGGALAALAGLLFVAISIRIDTISRTPHWRLRAFANIFGLVGLLIVAAIVLSPQPYAVMGIEIGLLNLFLLFYVPVRGFVRLSRMKGDVPHARLIAGIIAWGLGALGGASLALHIGGGLYLVAVSGLGVIWLSVLNAWSFLTVEAPSPQAAD